MLTFRTLCSGGELMGVGARQAGWAHVDGYEINERVAAVAQQNGFDVRPSDVCALDYEALPPVDHLHISPSCKSASQANEKGGETPADLAVAEAACRAIRAHQGRSFSLENVWGYRAYESFDRILAALRAADFVVDVQHVNAADFGVPQTRKRLILRAVRRSWRDRVPGLRPTHGKRGGVLLERWVGWYAAIEDLLDTLPETTPAPWQAKRLPKALARTGLYRSGTSRDHKGNEYEQGSRAPDEPAYTISTMSPGWYRALLVSSGSDWQRDNVPIRMDDAPALTITTNGEGRMRALLIPGRNTNQQWGVGSRAADEPAFTIDAGHKPSHHPRAYLVSGQNAGQSGRRGLTIREATAPVWTVMAGGSPGEYKAELCGRWVAMTLPALARFQTVPSDYRGLTAAINGEGVPCLLARRIMESLL